MRKLVTKKVEDWGNFKQVQQLGMELKERKDPVHLQPTPELRKMLESDEKPRKFSTSFGASPRILISFTPPPPPKKKKKKYMPLKG